MFLACWAYHSGALKRLSRWGNPAVWLSLVYPFAATIYNRQHTAPSVSSACCFAAAPLTKSLDVFLWNFFSVTLDTFLERLNRSFARKKTHGKHKKTCCVVNPNCWLLEKTFPTSKWSHRSSKSAICEATWFSAVKRHSMKFLLWIWLNACCRYRHCLLDNSGTNFSTGYNCSLEVHLGRPQCKIPNSQSMKSSHRESRQLSKFKLKSN